MLSYTIGNVNHLLDLVGASNPNPSNPGPTVIEAKIWDGRIVRADYYHGSKYFKPDAEVRTDIFYDLTPLEPLVDCMLKKGCSFVTITGTHDMVCCLEWSISSMA